MYILINCHTHVRDVGGSNNICALAKSVTSYFIYKNIIWAKFNRRVLKLFQALNLHGYFDVTMEEKITTI